MKMNTTMKYGEKGRNWCVTTFNINKYEEWKKIDNDKIKYMVYQMEECKSSGRKHVQGYIEMCDNTTMNNIKKILNDNTLHIEKRKGTDVEARNYCMKDDTKVMNSIEIGKFKANRKGERTDIKKMYEMIKNGCTINELMDANINTYTRYYKAFDRIRNNVNKENCNKFRKVKVKCLIGDAGCGKTRYVYDKYGVNNVYKLRKGNGDNIWFDGYDNEDILLIDDFYGWIKYSIMLEMIDGYGLQLDTKGGYTYAKWTKVFITSNVDIDKWYKIGATDALKRRINKIKYFVNDNTEMKYDIPIEIIKNNKKIHKDLFKENLLDNVGPGSYLGNTEVTLGHEKIIGKSKYLYLNNIIYKMDEFSLWRIVNDEKVIKIVKGFWNWNLLDELNDKI